MFLSLLITCAISLLVCEGFIFSVHLFLLRNTSELQYIHPKDHAFQNFYWLQSFWQTLEKAKFQRRLSILIKGSSSPGSPEDYWSSCPVANVSEWFYPCGSLYSGFSPRKLICLRYYQKLRTNKCYSGWILKTVTKRPTKNSCGQCQIELAMHVYLLGEDWVLLQWHWPHISS